MTDKTLNDLSEEEINSLSPEEFANIMENTIRELSATDFEVTPSELLLSFKSAIDDARNTGKMEAVDIRNERVASIVMGCLAVTLHTIELLKAKDMMSNEDTCDEGQKKYLEELTELEGLHEIFKSMATLATAIILEKKTELEGED